MRFNLLSENTSPHLDVITQILVSRGFSADEVPHYLNTTDNDILDPLLLSNMHEGYVLLKKHIDNNSKILVVVDCDVDGYSSSAILINYLHALYSSFVESNISYIVHEEKIHGLSDITVPEDIKLVITPDAASNDIFEIKELTEKGIEVLVLDHHEIETFSDYGVIINNQDGQYPNKTLTGGGVVYKFCCYWDSQCGTNYADNFLDLVALSLISDMTDIRNFETIHLIRKGLNTIQNSFFAAMCAKQSYSMKNEVTNIGVAWYITPYINATIRVGSFAEKILLFEAMLEHKGKILIPSTKRGCKGQLETPIEQACRNTTNHKKKQTTLRDELVELILTQIEKENLLDNKILVIKIPKEKAISKTITGLVCNELASTFQRPTLLLNEKEETWEGSCRNYSNSFLPSLRDFLLSTELVEYASGHNNALGTSIKKENVEPFIETTNTLLKHIDCKTPVYKVDFIFKDEFFDGEIISLIKDGYKLWGQEIPEPYIALEKLKITKNNLTLMSRDKNPTLKISLKNGVELIKFKSSEEEYETLYSDLGCVIVNVVGICEKNVWNGKTTPQIVIKEFEIIERQEYDF